MGLAALTCRLRCGRLPRPRHPEAPGLRCCTSCDTDADPASEEIRAAWRAAVLAYRRELRATREDRPAWPVALAAIGAARHARGAGQDGDHARTDGQATVVLGAHNRVRCQFEPDPF